MNYPARFETLISNLRSNPLIKVLYSVVGIPATQEDFDCLYKKGYKLPDNLKKFYEEMNGVLLKWETVASQQQSHYVGGSIEILPLRETFKLWKDEIWFEDDERFKYVKPFDFFIEEACSALMIDNRQVKETVHYHCLGETILDTKYTFDEYMDRMLKAKGALYWIETLCVKTASSLQSKDFFHYMPLLFDDFEPAHFIPKEQS